MWYPCDRNVREESDRDSVESSLEKGVQAMEGMSVRNVSMKYVCKMSVRERCVFERYVCEESVLFGR